MLRLTDLREILRYVPRFRDKVFVIAIDGAVVEDENFQNLLLDIALLRNLNVRVALVHGAAKQIQDYAARLGVQPSDIDGTGVTDASTLQIAITAANRVTHEILEGLTANDLRGACPNAVVAHPAGILSGVDKQFTGRIERVDGELLDAFLAKDIIPVVPPIGIDGVGRSYRLNSDAVAVELAKTLRAVKLIYLTTESGVRGPKGVIRQLTVEEAEAHLKRKPKDLSAEMATKLAHAVRAARKGSNGSTSSTAASRRGCSAKCFRTKGSVRSFTRTSTRRSARPRRRTSGRFTASSSKASPRTNSRNEPGPTSNDRSATFTCSRSIGTPSRACRSCRIPNTRRPNSRACSWTSGTRTAESGPN